MNFQLIFPYLRGKTICLQRPFTDTGDFYVAFAASSTSDFFSLPSCIEFWACLKLDDKMWQNLRPSCTSPLNSYLNFSFYRANSTCTVVEDELWSKREPMQAVSSAKQEFTQHSDCRSAVFVGRWTRRRRNEESLSKRLIDETIDTRWMPLKVSKIFRQWAA